MQVQYALNKLLSVARPKPLNKSNWAFWSKTFAFIGIFGSIHSLLFRLVPAVMTSSISVAENMDVDDHAGRDAAANDEVAVENAANAKFETIAEMDYSVRRHLENAVRKKKAMHFLSQGVTSLDESYILLQSLQPQIRLVRHLMSQSSVGWQAQEMAKQVQEGHRQYPLQTLQTLSHKMLQECFQTLQNKDKFAHVAQTHKNSARMIVCTLRSAAVVYELIVRSLIAYPQRLFKVLDDPSFSETIMADYRKGCMLDGFSRSFVEMYSSAGELQSEPAQLILRCARKCLDTNTFSTERLHSANLRHQQARIQTHGIELPDLAAVHTCLAGPAWMRSFEQTCESEGAAGERHHPQPSMRLRRHTLVRKRPAARRRKGNKTGKRRPGAGGPWRAFIHDKKLKGQFRGFTAELGAEYKQLSPQKRAHLADLGLRGTLAHRLGVRAFPKPPPQPSEQSSHSALPAAGNGSGGSVPAAAPATRAPASPIAGVKQTVKDFKQQLSSQPDDLRLRDLDALTNECAALLLHHHNNSMPLCQPYCPPSDAATYMCAPAWATSVHDIGCQINAATVVDRMVQSGQKFSLLDGAVSWQRKHLGAFTRPFPEPQAPQASSCFKAGVCHCGRDLVWRRRFQMQAAAVVKRLFIAGSKARERLTSGRSILWWAAASGDFDQYTHVSLQYLKPWRPTFTLLQRVAQDEFRIRGRDGAVFLQSFLEFTFDLTMDVAWSVQELAITDTVRPCANFLLLSGTVPADGEAAEAQSFWAGLDEEIRIRRQRVEGLVEAFLRSFMIERTETFRSFSVLSLQCARKKSPVKPRALASS